MAKKDWDGDVFATVKVRMQVYCETNKEPTPETLLKMLQNGEADVAESDILEYTHIESIDGGFID